MPQIPGSKAAYYDSPEPQDTIEDFGKRQAEKIRAIMTDDSIRVVIEETPPEEMNRLRGTSLGGLEAGFGRNIRQHLDGIWSKNVTRRD